ncbi:MAG: SWIM zinc finger family protein [Candidatus Thermoplasmatota archaeon]|nr:SWIM zinc finger family protein [Candidatus Thermoplasmatota archaeon]
MSYGYWGYYKPAKPKKVKKGIKAKSKRGTIGETWWSKRWISSLESFHHSNRLSRGRSYARKGQVISIDIKKGIATSKVQGTRSTPYVVKISLPVFPDKKWEMVTDVMAAKAIFSAKLLAGEMPHNIEDAFEHANISLFPKNKRELKSSCSCPDSANPCKHIAAVYYLLAEQFDEDPFLIFKLRGRTKKAVLQNLRDKRSVKGGNEIEEPFEEKKLKKKSSIKLDDRLDHFWYTGKDIETLSFNLSPPEIKNAVLKRLGNAPFDMNKKNIVNILEKGYDIAGEMALQKAYEDMKNKPERNEIKG